jgi:hypothetical protein
MPYNYMKRFSSVVLGVARVGGGGTALLEPCCAGRSARYLCVSDDGEAGRVW